MLASGFVLLIAGLALLVVGTANSGTMSTGGVVFIGPFPLVFGSGPAGWELALVSVVIGGVMLVALLLWGRRMAQAREV